MYVPRAMYSLLAGDAALVGRGHVHREQDRRGGVDGHRRGDLTQGQVVEQHIHVLDGTDGHAHPADLPGGERRIRVVAHLRGQVEGDRQPRLALLEQVAEALVGLARGREAGVLTHGPQPAAVHRRLDTTRIGVLTGEAEGLVGRQIGRVGGVVDVSDLDIGRGGEALAPLAAALERLGARRVAPTCSI